MNEIPVPRNPQKLEPPSNIAKLPQIGDIPLNAKPGQDEEGEPSREDCIEMRCYIKYNIYYGQKLADIINQLLKAGWKRDEIEKAYRELKASSQPLPHSSSGRYSGSR